jgi:ACR3 family arsenite transporter
MSSGVNWRLESKTVTAAACSSTLKRDEKMRTFGRILSALGSNGPSLLVASLCLGIIFHPLGEAGYKVLPLSAFLLTLGSFLTAGLANSEERTRYWVLGAVLAWVGIGLPLAAALLLRVIPIDPTLRAGVLLTLLAPPVGSAAAIAAMLGLRTRLALVVSISLTTLTPISIPIFATLFGLGIRFDMGGLAMRLLIIIGMAALISFLALKHRAALAAVLPNQRSSTGIAVVGLIIVGLATSHGILSQWRDSRAGFEGMLAAAVAINCGLCLLSSFVFSRLGLPLAGTIGLLSGNRNVTLAWAAASFGLPPLAEGYVAACVIPVLMLPLIVKIGTNLYTRAPSTSLRAYGVPRDDVRRPASTSRKQSI